MVQFGNNSSSMATKVGMNGEVYAVLLEPGQANQEQPSVIEEMQKEDVRTGVKLGRARHRRQPNSCLGWSLMVTIGATCLAVFVFHLWVTWHLQQKVSVLQAQVDSLSALDLEELRAQLRDLYDLRDLNANDRDTNSGLPGLPTSADEDQDDDPFAENLLADSAKQETSTMTSSSSEFDDTAYDDDKDDDSSDEDDDDDEEGAKVKNNSARRKRQADLSSHTEDGVPIYDRGYGLSLNRTEGLRIYQSLLATGGRGEPRSPDINWQQATDPPILPHHRQNSFWRERKEHKRHPHHRSSTASPLEDASNNDHYPIRPRPASQHNPALHKNSNVEFRHSRVKPSSSSLDVISTSTPASVHVYDDQALWSTSRDSVDDRMNAATAPAVLTQTATTSSARIRPQNVLKVTQPAMLGSRTHSSQQTTADKEDLIPRSSNKKRVNKKQLRDLSHVATAVHLVADSRNDSTAFIDNQVEVASRNELGLHTSWKVASNSMDSPHRTQTLVKIDGATLTVRQSGLYFIYSQVHYLDEHSTNAYEVFINTEPFLRCVTSAFISEATSMPKANTCYTAGATYLREGDKLFLRDIEPLRFSVLQPSKTFFGLVRLAPIADFS